MPLHITIRQIQLFEAVARHGSFTRAARELHLTQPAVS
ncbi:MAG: LysR family transcriptional regulator, partial [Pirellulales bacterium]|nr:LysR family transcriptional regulator [Pirellulales bacterium]